MFQQRELLVGQNNPTSPAVRRVLKPVQFKIMFNVSNEVRKRIASYLVDAYAQAGILAEPEPVEWSVMLKRLDDRQYDV